MIKRVFILLNGGRADISEFDFNEGDIFICADGGIKRILKKKLKNKIILVGDFDSINKKDVKYKNIKIKEFPKDKDWTDGELAVKYACGHFNRKIPKLIIGGISNKLDHTLGNILTLVPYIRKGHYFEIYGINLKVYASSKNIKIKTKINRIISIVPLEKSYNITTEGLRWKIYHENILPYKSRTLRNLSKSNNVKINFKRGVILAIETW